jgi:putative endonuclease
VKEEKMYYVYMVRCRDGSLYTGYAVNVEARVKLHNESKGSRYCRGKLPVVLVYKMGYDSVSFALKEEYRIKNLSRADKERIITGFKSLEKQQKQAKQMLD